MISNNIKPEKQSKINSNFKYSESTWVVSLINTGKGSTGRIGGHSVISLEGLEKEGLFYKEYIRQADILAAIPDEEISKIKYQGLVNVKGYISEVRIFEALHPQGFTECVGKRSFYVLPINAKKMLDSIYQDKATTEIAKINMGKYLPYQLAGNTGFFGDGISHNCPTWCYEKLEIAGISITIKPIDLMKAMPQAHLTEYAPVVEKTIDTTSTTCMIL